MRTLALLTAALTLSACATTPAPVSAPPVERAHMPLEILRAKGEAPRMGEAYLMAGSYREDSLFSLRVGFDSDGEQLGQPDYVGWTVRFGNYCKDRPSWVQSVLIGSSGQVWRGFRVAVPPGPDRMQDWSSGATGAVGPDAGTTAGLLEVIAGGGRFTLALEDDDGERWRPTVIDTLTPAERERLFEANRRAVLAADPDMPVAEERLLVVVEAPPVTLPNPPRPCP